MKYGKMFHALHPDHPLELDHKASPYECDGCGQVGFNSRYACKEGCDVHLHRDCADPPSTITHPFFPGCRFDFLPMFEPNRRCDACGEGICGFVYHCFGKECMRYGGFDMHPCCANLKREMEAEGVKLKLRKKTSADCCLCGRRELEKNVRSWSYVSEREGIHIHVSCVKKLLLESWNRESLNCARGGDAMALEKWVPKLQIAVRNDGRKGEGKLSRFLKMIKIAIPIIIAAILGDPVSVVVGLFASLIPH